MRRGYASRPTTGPRPIGSERIGLAALYSAVKRASDSIRCRSIGNSRSLSFSAKIPGPQLRLGNVNMQFEYTDYFGEQANTGYERLLYDAMVGDATLFQRADMVEAGWCVVQPILDVWKALPPRRFPNYAPATWGPAEAEELMSRRGREWRNGD